MDAYFPTAKIYNPQRPALHARSTASCCSPTRRARRARSCTSASTRPAPSRPSPRSARRTRRRASRSSRSTSSTRCSGSSAPATRCGRPATRWRAASSSAPPPAARRSPARACSTPTATRTCSRRPTRQSSPTTRRTATRSGTSCATGLERMYGGAARRTRTSCTTSRSTTSRSSQPAEPEDVDVDGILRGIYKLKADRGRRTEGAAARVGRRRSVGARGAGAAREGLGRGRRCLERHLVDRAAPRRPRRRRAQLPAPRREQPHVPYVTQKLQGAEGPFVAVSDFMHAVQDQIRAVRARRLRDARRRRLRLQRHPCRRPSLLQDRRTVDRRAHAAVARRARRGRPVAAARRRSRSTGCTT